ncbi:MAG: HAMP domain-containing histidine kinase [Flavobacterium sp.]|nr:MAG: HAMP domain-containing histidine kinase [Flavobacterium sp.]
MLPILVEKVVYKNIDRNLIEKKGKFISHLDRQEISEFIVRNDSTETYASFSTLHNEFVQLSRVSDKAVSPKTTFINDPRVIEAEQNDYRILQYDFTYENVRYRLEIGSSLAEIEDLVFVIRWFVIGLLVAIVVMTFLLDTVYIEYLLKPFYKIVDTKIRRATQPERFDHTPISSGTSDFRELDAVLNGMMDRIQALFQKEKQFIANVSHELLTPIALLQNRLENLMQNPSLDETAVDKIDASLRTLDRLKKTINNLLLISRIENNQYEANEAIDFKGLFQVLTEELEDRLADKNIRLSVSLNEEYPFMGNSTLLHILFFNLMINAIKYNVDGGMISVIDGFDDDGYFISVADSGKGIGQEQIQNIFNRFTRIDLSQEGQGIGLAIADSIAQFHHIGISVTSEKEIGSNFTLRFPKAK